MTKRATRSATFTTRREPRLGFVLAIVSAGWMLATIDLFIVNIAFPTLQRSFHGAHLSTLSWVLNGYTIVFAALLVPAGRLGRPNEPEAELPRRGRGLHTRIGALRGRKRCRRPDRRPRRPGDGRGSHGPVLARASTRRVPSGAAPRRGSLVVSGGRPLGRGRPGARRSPAHRRLALDLPDQPSNRRGPI